MSPTSTILIVDDEVAVLRFFERALQRDGHHIITAASGAAALDVLSMHELDLALLDLRLKDMSGLDVFARLRQQSPATPVIIITAHGSLESAVQALRQGAHDYLLKPCSMVDLRRSVQAGLLKRAQALDQLAQPARPDLPVNSELPADSHLPVVQHQGLMIDSIRHVLTLDGVPLDLSPLEFSLLAYLIEEAPRVVAVDELIRKVQGYQQITVETRDTLRSHIYHIRAKIKATAGRELIRTVRGVGYAIAE
ncbi:MAG: response regulator transcription factor [Chloroflexi bacterium]|nr:response regulator transcription factor [Chloroflexota bacterium]